MILILMAIFIFSSPVSANDNVDAPYGQPLPDPEINIYVRPPMPHVVNYSENIILEWDIKRLEEEKANYFIEIYEFNKPEEVYKKWPFSISEGKKVIRASMELPVSKEIFHDPGKYQVEIKYGGMGEYKPLSVGEPRGNLTINKFYDDNLNGKKDENERGLNGWNFIVKFRDDPEVRPFTITTRKGGTYTCYNLSVGNYTITETLKECWRNTTSISEEAVVNKDQTTIVNFGNYEVGTLEIIKFNDTDRDGIRDPAKEEGLSNWNFSVTFPNGTSIDVPTGEDGTYTFHDAPVGHYEITEIKKEGWIASTPTTNVTEVKPCKTAKVKFGNYFQPPLPGWISILKFNDTNRNGIQDDGESPISNWGFRIKDSSDSVIIRHTDEHGKIIQELTSNAEYEITENFRVGWNNTTPRMRYVYIKPGEVANVTFGNYMPTPIFIQKFNDTLKENGVRDMGEEGLAGWDFRVTGPSVDRIISTDENGEAIFKDAIPGQYYKIEELMREEQREEGWKPTTTLIREKIEVIEGQTVTVEFGNIIPIPPSAVKPCIEYGIYMNSVVAPRIHNNSDENLRVEKYLDPRIVHCDNPDPDIGEIINVTLRVCVLAGMEPTDLVFAVDTSGSLFEREGAVLKVIKDGIIKFTEFIEKNEARFGENVRIGLVSWDEKIDETVNLTTNYSEVKKACGILETLPEEDTLYQVGLNGSIEVFNRSPREDVRKLIVFVTDAKGTSDYLSNYSQLPDTSAYVIHAITVGPTQNEGIVNMLDNFTSQYNGTAVRVNESYEELEKALTTLTVSCIERRTLKNVTLVETLPKHMRALNESYEIKPTSEHINSDGMEWNTVTMKWNIGNLSSDKCWENTFKVLFCCRVPVDVTQPEGISRVTSEVTYSDPTNITVTKHLLIPEGGLWIEPPQVPKGLLEKIRKVPGFEALLAIAGLLAVGYMMWRRKR